MSSYQAQGSPYVENPDGSWTITDITRYWHAAPLERFTQVLQEGLLPNQPPSFSRKFPERIPGRVYLSPHPGNLIDLIGAGMEDGMIELGGYIIFEVVPPIGTRMYFDPDDLAFFSVYTTSPIPGRNIRMVGKLMFTDEIEEVYPSGLEEIPFEDNIPSVQ